MAQIIYRLMTQESREYFATEQDYFTDVGDIPERVAINTLANAGIVVGYAGDYRPDSIMTKAEMATIAARFLDVEGGSGGFFDTLGHWAESHINQCVSVGIIEGGELFFPNDPVNYGQALDFIISILEYGGQP